MNSRLKIITGAFLFFAVILPTMVEAEPGDTYNLKDKIAAHFNPEFKIYDLFEKSPPRKVAIIPFINKTKKKEASRLLRSSFYNHFGSLRYTDQELFLTDRILLENPGYETENITPQTAIELGELLDVDAIITGEITHYQKIFAVLYSNVSVGLKTKILSTKDGSALWEAKHVVRTHKGSFTIDPLGIAMGVLSNAWNIRDSQFIKLADQLARELVETIPDLSLSTAMAPPKIFSLLHNASGGPVKSGFIIKIQMQGEPKNLAHCQIQGTNKKIRLNETAAGEYYGEYMVNPGDNISDGVLFGYLTREDGVSAHWFDILGKIEIDTIPPGAPINFRVVNGKNGAKLKWDAVNDPGLSGFIIHRSETPLTGYQKIGETQFMEYSDTGIKPGKEFYYRVSAQDLAGNESEKSNYLKGVSVKPGPTEVLADIKTDTVWYAGCGPYIIGERSITIHSPNVLRIEPGTIVLSKYGGIRVRGKLIVDGKADMRISFKPHKETVGGNVWGGIFFDNTNDQKSSIAHANIQGSMGITLVSSSPEIKDSYLQGNINGIVIKDNSSPEIIGNTIENNRSYGVKILRSSPVLKGNVISANQQVGVWVEGGSPIITNNTLSGNNGFDLFQKAQGGVTTDVSDNYWGTVSPDMITLKFYGPFTLKNYYSSWKKKTLAPYAPVNILSTSEVQRIKKEADKAFMGREYETALSKYNNILLSQKDNHSLYFLTGLVYLKTGDTQRAINRMRKAITLDPNRYGYHFNLGMAYRKANLLEKARESFEETLGLSPGHEKATKFLKELK